MKAKAPWLIRLRAKKAKRLIAELHLSRQAAEVEPLDYMLNHRPVEVIRDELAALLPKNHEQSP